MSSAKGKKAKPGKKGAAKPKKKARSEQASESAEVQAAEELAAGEAAPEEPGEEQGGEARAAAPDESASEAEAAGAEPHEASAATDDAPLLVEGEAAASGGDDEDAPIDPSGPSTAVADLPRDEQRKLVESLVFVSDRAISAQQLGRMLKIKSALAKELADELIEAYSGRGIELVELSGGYQFRSAASSAHVVREHIAQPPVRLTRAQLETLALVAYRQPITRPEIDDVRGVDSGSALRVLLERGLLKMLGRKDEPGRPLLYGTTPFFLDFFGMRSLKDLPTLREFTELSDENRALFKRKTGETIEEAEAALLAAEEAAQREDVAQQPNGEGEGHDELAEHAEHGGSAEPALEDEASAGDGPTDGEAGGGATAADSEAFDRDLEVEAETFAAGSLQTSPDSDRSADEEEREGDEDPERSPAPEA